MYRDRDLEGTHAATSVGVTGKDDAGTDNTTDSDDYELAARKNIETDPDNRTLRSSNSTGILPARKPGQPSQFHPLIPAERPDLNRKKAEDERRNQPDQPDDPSALPPRKDLRRQP